MNGGDMEEIGWASPFIAIIRKNNVKEPNMRD